METFNHAAPRPSNRRAFTVKRLCAVTETEWQNFLRKLPHTANLPQAKGAAGAKRCVSGTQCYETPCVDGKKGVVFCDDNGICDGNQYIIDCP